MLLLPALHIAVFARPKEAWEEKYGTDGSDSDAPFEKLCVLSTTSHALIAQSLCVHML